jgi:transposase, IS30 family
MPASKGKHLTKENREVIEFGIKNKDSARTIAKRIDVSPSTIVREVKQNRTMRTKKVAKGMPVSTRCKHYSECSSTGSVCEKCLSAFTLCKKCKTRNCIDVCSDFERKMCPTTQKWPYVCPDGCHKRTHCGYPKFSYNAHDANESYKVRLSDSRKGICLSNDELDNLRAFIVPLIKQGHSLEAIWATYGHEISICVRSAYYYQQDGLFDLPNLDFPSIVRRRAPKKTRRKTRDRVDRTGRTYEDFLALPIHEQARVVQGDSVCGYDYNEHDVLSLEIVACGFQGFFYKKHESAQATIACLDEIERACGSCEAFELFCPILLVDRGCEFDDWQGMERSCLEPEKRRCRVFYCDAMESNQKSQAERNHQQLRRILPKGRTDFDKLSACDVAICCSHINSYPLPTHAGKCGFDMISALLPAEVLSKLGICRVPYNDVVLKPYLMSHAVVQ